MRHQCRYLILHCIDYRLANDFWWWLKSNHYLGDCDMVSVAGGVKDLVSPGDSADQNYLLKQIHLSRELHQIKEVVLINHTDCGAYGGSGAFNDSSEEEAKHLEDMKKAATLIRKRWPDLSVVLVLIKMEGIYNHFVEIKQEMFGAENRFCSG